MKNFSGTWRKCHLQKDNIGGNLRKIYWLAEKLLSVHVAGCHFYFLLELYDPPVRGIPRPASELQVRIESPPPAREGGGFPQYFPPLDQPPIDCTNVLSFVIRKKNTEEPQFIGQLPLDRPRFRSISVTD